MSDGDGSFGAGELVPSSSSGPPPITPRRRVRPEVDEDIVCFISLENSLVKPEKGTATLKARGDG
jgi:hypothetical protein